MASYNARYGGDEDGGGGGFLQGSQANLNTPGGSRRPEQVVRPVTIKQLLDAEPSNTDSSITIQDTEVSNVSFCAVVRGMNRNPTNVLLQMEDGTGMIEVRRWIDASDGETEGLDVDNGIQEHDWVRVIGSPKIFNGKKHVAGLRLLKIDDFNQINYHLLDAVRVTLVAERGSMAGNAMVTDKEVSNPVPKPLVHNSFHDSRTPGQIKIMELFTRVNVPDEGVHVQEIARECRLNLRDVVAEISKLVADGELYNTVDDDHVMPTSN